MYDSSMKYKWDNQNVLDYARQEAKLEGKLEGEYQKAIDIAKEMKREGIPPAQISKFTKLSIEEIEKL